MSLTLAGKESRALAMPPPPPRAPKRPAVVLDEDDWTSKMEAIIERDFYPELSKLENKVEWLQAIRTGDPERIRQAQLAIAARRAGLRPPTGIAATPAGGPLFTPGGTGARAVAGDTPYIPVLPPGRPAALLEEEGEEGGGGGAAAPLMSLDAFLATHTSEDNASFQEVMDDVNKRRRQRYADRLNQQHPELLEDAGRQGTDGFGTTGQPTGTLIGWRHDPLNALFYDSSNRESVPLSDKEQLALVQGAPKQINHSSTRFASAAAGTSGSGTPSASGASDSVTAGGAARAAAAVGGGTRGYDVLATPSFDPGVEESPFMTWGDIQATPLRIEAEDLPPGGAFEGVQGFRFSEPTRKEQRAAVMASKAKDALKKRAGVRGPTPLVSSVLAAARRPGTGAGTRPGSTGGGVSKAAPQLSQAARRLASSMHRGKRPDTDMALRASYRGPTQQPGAPSGGSSARPGGSGWSSAAPTPVRGATPAGLGGATPHRATLEEEGLRMAALAKQREARERRVLQAARDAALRSMQKNSGPGAAGPAAAGPPAAGRPAAAPGGSGLAPAAAGAAAGSGGGDLTAGLLNL